MKQETEDSILAAFAIILSVGLTATMFWFVYKIFSGIFHLLEKLIDKI